MNDKLIIGVGQALEIQQAAVRTSENVRLLPLQYIDPVRVLSPCSNPPSLPVVALKSVMLPATITVRFAPTPHVRETVVALVGLSAMDWIAVPSPQSTETNPQPMSATDSVRLLLGWVSTQ